MAQDVMPGTAGVSDISTATPDATAPLMAFLLTGQHASFFEKLYASEAVCLGLFRLLPPLMRQVVMAMLWSQSHFRSKDLKVFLKLSPNALHDELDTKLQVVLNLSIVSKQTHRGTINFYLHQAFKQALRNALTGGGQSKTFGVTYAGVDEDLPDLSVEQLVEHGNRTWEGLLKYMVSSRSYAAEVEEDIPHKDVLDLLVQCGLMAPSQSNDSGGYQITSKGFQFLLEDRSLQIWQILMFYVQLRKQESGGQVDGVEIIKLYFTLGSMQLGRAYSSKGLPREQMAVLDRLEDYGMIVRPDGKNHDRFYPTRLGTTLCSGATAADSGGFGGRRAGEGFVILETNYKIYAYTSNELEIAILNLFIDIRVRYPNLIVGKLDRGTVKRAMEEGITANQIISYLTTHAHPQMHKNTPLLPITVVDQLHLWDRERNRLQSEPAALFDFKQRHLFDDAVAYARTLDSLLWEHGAFVPGQGFFGRLVVSDFARIPLAEYLQNRRQQHDAM